MSNAREDRASESPGEVDRLLDELLAPPDAPGLAEWRVAEVPAAQVRVDAPTAVAVPDRHDRRNQVLAALFATALVLCLGAAIGYWFGTRSQDDLATPIADPDTTPGPDTAQEPDVAPGSVDSSAEQVENRPPDASVVTLGTQLEAIDLARVEFVAGTDRLTPDGQTAVAEIGAVLAAHPLIPVEVRVATYTEANPGQNHGLSTLQADALIDGLLDAGADPSNLVSIGVGSRSQPSTSGRTFLLFDTSDADLAAALQGVDPSSIKLDEAGTLTRDAKAILDRTAEALALHPTAELSLVAYAYLETSSASHDRSHALADQAAAELAERGIGTDRISTLGMADAPVDVDLGTELDIEIGPSAALSVALGQLDNEKITFVSGTDELTEEGLALMAELIEALAIDPTRKIEVLAHTYSEPSSQENHDLSHRQGEEVVGRLVAAGTAPDRLQIVGHGDPPQFAKPGRDNYVILNPLR